MRGGARSLRARVEDARLVLRPRGTRARAGVYLADRRLRARYRELTEQELRATRRSDTVFLFGSGKSLLDIDDAAWSRMGEHDTVGLSHFHRARYVRVDYHLVAEVNDRGEYVASLRENPLYRDTIYLVQEGYLAEAGNELVGRGLLPEAARVFRWKRIARARYAPPSSTFDQGIVHGWNSITDATNVALLTGWRRIVLVGVDMYDSEYFWLPQGVTNPWEWRDGTNARSPFGNADRTVDLFRRWRALVEPGGVRLEVYNPRSLLAHVLDVFDWEAA